MSTYAFIRGKLKFNKPVDQGFIAKYNAYSETYHCSKSNELIMQRYPDWKERTLFGELGRDGEFFITEEQFKDILYSQKNKDLVIDENHGYAGSPYSNWIISKDGSELVPWEPKYDKDYAVIDNPQGYIDELIYLTMKVFGPLGYILNGELACDEGPDQPNIVIINNVVFFGRSWLNRGYYGTFTIDNLLWRDNDTEQKEILKDRDIAFKLLKLNCISLFSLESKYREDREFVLQELSNLEGNRYADSYTYINSIFRNDEEVMTAAIKASPKFAKVLDPELLNSKKFIKKIIKINPAVMVQLKKTKWVDDKDIYQLVAKLNKKYIKYFTEKASQ